MHASLQVPNRQDLLDRLDRANRLATVWVVLQLALIVFFCWLIDWPNVVRRPLIPIVALVYMVGSFLMSLMMLWAQNKKEIGDLKETTRYGEYDKHALRRIFQDTLTRLGLPDQRLPVYITADKQLNAATLNLGLLGFIGSLNGVYLNRQVLHRLSREEIQDLMGHELGHYYRYYLISSRFAIVTIALGAVIGVYISQFVGQNDFINFIVLGGCGWVFWTLANWSSIRHGQTIEYLCDDFGAQVHNVGVSINGLMKLGVEQEVQLAIAQQVLKSKHFGNLSSRDMVEAIENAIPFGHATRDELSQALEKSLERQAAKGREVSLVGFFNYIWRSDLDADAHEEYEKAIAKATMLQQIPRLKWESLLRDPQNLHFDEWQLPKLIDLIERHPDQTLFHSPDALDSVDGVHPPIRLRILYLWHNRQEIERTRLRR